MPAPYLSPRHLFIAYAKMLATQYRSPRVRDYHAMKYRLLTGLFDANLHIADEQHIQNVTWIDPNALAGRSIAELENLAKCYSYESYYHPTSWGDHRELWLEQLPGTRESLRQIRRLSARMRQAYASMAIELLELLYPGIGSRRIHIGRLAELGLPDKLPKNGWDYRILDDGDDEESSEERRKKIYDDLSPEMLGWMKEQEENIEKARRKTAIEKAVIIERAITADIGTAETVPGIIYEMEVTEFLKLTEGFPGLSRVDFKPHQDDEDFPF